MATEQVYEQAEELDQQAQPEETQLAETQPKEERKEDWEHKYRVLQGKYNAEVPRLQSELKQLKHELEFMSEKNKLFEQILKEKAEASSLTEDDDIKKFKEDFPEIYTAVTKLIDKGKKEFSKEVEKQIAPAQQTAQISAQQVFLTRLSTLVPDWQEWNEDQGFLAWLQETDRFTRKRRHDLLLEAYNRHDADAVAEFFNAYKEANKKPNQQQNVAPPVGKSRVYTGSGQVKKTWKVSEIEQFYRNVALNRVSPEKAKSIEADILEAAKEGRILYE